MTPALGLLGAQRVGREGGGLNASLILSRLLVIPHGHDQVLMPAIPLADLRYCIELEEHWNTGRFLKF